MRVEIHLLGRFEVAVEGERLPASAWHRRSAAALVKLLALHTPPRLPREQVIDALWPDLLLEEAAPRLHKAAHYARAALGSREGVVVEAGMVALAPAGEVVVDVAEFERAVDLARAAGTAESARAAAVLYPGDLLPEDLYEPWTEETRARLRLRRLELLAAAGLFEELVTLDPLDEQAHLALARDHVEAGRRQAALAALDRLGEIVERELGTELGPEAVTLRRAAEALPLRVAGGNDRAVVAGLAPARLPARRTRLVGRRADQERVTGLLRDHRVVTLTGPGGAGKSTLALEVARTLSETEGDLGMVVLAELGPVRDDDGVIRAVAEAAGVQGEGAVRVGTLGHTLGQHPVLLLLDNCEHLVDAVAGLVDAILDAGGETRVLATSREPLRVGGEAEHRLGSLGSQSTELFVERATAAVGEGVVTSDDPLVVELCERLDGLPLPIELAAAQLRHLGLAELVARLDERLTLLVGGRPRAGQRHSALTATIEWSYRLLDAEARQVFDRLGVFPAGFDLAAVQAVSGGDSARVTNVLGDLVAKSLVVHEPVRGRYHLLETIRLYAAERLESRREVEETTERLRSHVVARATRQSRVASWLSTSLAARSRDDVDNVRLAFDACLARGAFTDAVDLAIGLSTLWRNAVSYAEGRRWVDALRAHDLEGRDLVWTSILEADIGLGSGDARVMRRAADGALALSAGTGDDGATLIATIYDAMVYLGAPDLAAERLLEAGRRAAQLEEDGLARLARGFRMVALLLLGRTDGLREEGRALTDGAPERDYARYLCHWAASMVALVERDGSWLRHLMDQQRQDLSTTALHENWLTLYWGALALMAEGEDHLDQLRRARARAEGEGRGADADCVLALAYAAARGDRWEEAAQLLGSIESVLLHDTASYLHHAVIDRQLVRRHLAPSAYERAAARGRGRPLRDVLDEYGV